MLGFLVDGHILYYILLQLGQVAKVVLSTAIFCCSIIAISQHVLLECVTIIIITILIIHDLYSLNVECLCHHNYTV